MKSFLHRMSPEELSRLRRRHGPTRRPASDPETRFDPTRVSVAIVDHAVGWVRGDPAVWRRLHERFVSSRRGPDGAWVNLGPLPIPSLPPGNGPEWKRIFECVYHEFRRLLAAHGEDDRGTSYSLSYLALRRCARRGKQDELAYVYQACSNAHKRHHKRLINRRWRVAQSDDLAWVGVRPEDVDLRLDLEAVLRRLPPGDAAVCRTRLIEERTFQEIGASLGIDPSTACRRFDRQIGVIRATLRDYRPGDSNSRSVETRIDGK